MNNVLERSVENSFATQVLKPRRRRIKQEKKYEPVTIRTK